MFMKEAILGMLRHLFTAGGGYLTAKGLAVQDETTAAIAAAVTLVGFVWSVVDKKKNQ